MYQVGGVGATSAVEAIAQVPAVTVALATRGIGHPEGLRVSW